MKNSISKYIKMKLIPLILITLFTQSTMAQKADNSKTKEVNIKFIGEYYTGRGPCQLLPNGTRRWRYMTGFKVKESILGNIQVNNIEINPNYNSNINVSLDAGKDYMISLTLDKERGKILENKDTLFTHLNLITNGEIVKIIKAEDTNLRYGEEIIIKKIIKKTTKTRTN